MSKSPKLFPGVLQHEKFTSGLQLSHKPCSSDTNAASHKSPAKTPTKAVKSPSGSRATADGLPSSRDSQTKPGDTHKAEERTGGEKEGPVTQFCRLMQVTSLGCSPSLSYLCNLSPLAPIRRKLCFTEKGWKH